MAAINLGAQDATPPDDTNPPPPKPRKSKDIVLPATPISKDTTLLEKLKAAGANVSPPVMEIVRMSDAGSDTAVIQAFVETSPVAYNLKSEEIIYLKDHGIAPSIITAMIQHGAKLREQAAATQTLLAASQPPASPSAPIDSAPIEMPAQGYTPSPAYAYPSEPAYYPSYPYYYPSYYYPWYPSVGVVIGRPYYRHYYGAYHNHGFSGGTHGFHSGPGLHSGSGFNSGSGFHR